MTTNQNAYELIINGNVIHPINPNEIKGTIVNEYIELNLEEITAKEYFDIIKKRDEKRESILPYIDLESKDEKGHLYFLPLEVVYEHLNLSIPYSIQNRNIGYIRREKDIHKPNGRTIEV